MPPYVIAFFTNAGVPETGLSPTIRIRRIDTGALVVTDASMTELGDGLYKYDFSGYDQSLDYAFRCDGGATLDNVERYVAGDSFDLDNTEDILDDTNEMQGKLPTNNIMGSSVKTDKDDEIDAIKAKTDSLTFNGSNILSEDQSPIILFQPIFLGGFDYYDFKQAQPYPVYIVDAKGRVTLNAGHVTTPGSYIVVRYRQNQSAVVQSGALTVGTTNGLNVYFTFDPDTAPNDIKPGDSISLVFLDTVVTIGGQVFDMPTITLGPFTVVDSVSEPGEIQALSTSTSIITDITGPGDDTYNNMQLQVISNFGGSVPIKLTRQIKDFDQATGTFTVEPAFPVAPVAGDIALVIANITEDLDAKDRMLGLLHQNIAVEHTFVGDNHIQSDYWIYDTKANANTHDKSTGLLFTYSLVTTFDVNDKPSVTKMVKDS